MASDFYYRYYIRVIKKALKLFDSVLKIVIAIIKMITLFKKVIIKVFFIQKFSILLFMSDNNLFKMQTVFTEKKRAVEHAFFCGLYGNPLFFCSSLPAIFALFPKT